MKKSIYLKISSATLAVVMLFASCSSTTLITSVPNGAKVYINGESVGTTPYQYSDNKIVGSTISVELRKEGYENFYTSFSRDEQVDAGAIIGGFFFLFPFLWTMKYKATHNYELVPIQTSQNNSIENSLSILHPELLSQTL